VPVPAEDVHTMTSSSLWAVRSDADRLRVVSAIGRSRPIGKCSNESIERVFNIPRRRAVTSVKIRPPVCRVGHAIEGERLPFLLS
jgi:hypothetical protein